MPVKDETYLPILATGYYPVRGGECFAIRIGKRPTEKGKRQRYKCHTERTKEAAEEFIARWNKDIREKDPVSLNDLTRKQKAEIIYTLERLDEIGVSLRHAIDTFIEKTNPISLKMKISTAYEKFEDIQRAEKVDKESISHPRSIFKRLIKFLKDKPIGLVTKNDIRKFLNIGKCNETTKRTYLRNLNAFFNKLKREGLNTDNPCEGIKISAVTKISKGYEPWELYVFLNECLEQKKWKTLTAFVFSGFFGLRLKESTGILWENMPDIENKDGFIDVQVDIAKTRRRRTLYLSGVGKSWLRMVPVNLRKGPLANMRSIVVEAREIRKICKYKYSEFSLGTNQARQAFAANHYAKHRDIEKLRMMMGNSPSVISTNYNGLVKDNEDEIYWQLYAPSILINSLEKAISSKMWKRFKNVNLNFDDFVVFDINTIENSEILEKDLLAVPKSRITALEVNAEAEGYDEKQKQEYIIKALSLAKRKITEENRNLVEAIIFKKDFGINAADLNQISEIRNTKKYLERKIGRTLEMPEVFEKDLIERETLCVGRYLSGKYRVLEIVKVKEYMTEEMPPSTCRNASIFSNSFISKHN